MESIIQFFHVSRCTHPKVFIQGYACHLDNLCLMARVQTLPIEVDDLFIDYIITLMTRAERVCSNKVDL